MDPVRPSRAPWAVSLQRFETITDETDMAIGATFPEVLAAAQAGDQRAMESLYRDLAPAVVGYLRGRRAAEPEDAAGEVFVAVIRGLTAFRGDEKGFRSWVFAIAHRRLMDERRRLARRGEQTVDPGELSARVENRLTGDVETEALERSGEGWALRALGRLTEEQREVLLLRVVADLPVAEVARIVGRSEGAVKALQRRALSALARQIEREGVS
jgi:RNA polymerase sigma factor (sigma-70 family)